MDISGATVRVAPDLLKALAILSDTTVRTSAVDQEETTFDKGHIFQGDQKFYYLQVFQRKKTNKAVVFSCRPFPNLKYRDHQ